MVLIDFFLARKKNTANIAKERLHSIVAERRGSNEPYYLPQLKSDLLEVISKYAKIDITMISIQLDQKDENLSILELNVKLTDTH
ncbi:cell division topological specificity factor MinE [Candidatus Moranella endobia]|uniref:Cell division topological specificity factor n=1 Tax=Moranella endobia (strain PCIT) TaxID=903503 RepID=F7XXJ2_MOREP|nr:cell division topological specificity factor MinE [Candidatus Moranella endobia]AEI74818.1 cell division topological specificity factor MinE [Candidatus Moranella endobia PCIT]